MAVSAVSAEPAVAAALSAGQVDRSTFTGIMSSFPTGVSIITTLDVDGTARGLTSNAICSVSVDPPIVLACVDRESNTLPALLARGAWVVNFLARDRGSLSDLFATKSPAKFDQVEWRQAANGMPWLHKDTISHAACRTVQVIEAGDHLILLGQVESGSIPDVGGHPLVYYRRSYHHLPIA